MQIRIRHATLEDLDAMLVWRGHSTADREAIIRGFEGLSSGRNLIFLAFAADRLVGTVQLVREHSDADLVRNALYVQGLEVHEDYRRTGIAQLLLGTLEDQARLGGCVRATVMIEPDNQASLTVFTKLGFQAFKNLEFNLGWSGVSDGLSREEDLTPDSSLID
jgi:GNAT superfamily N-acetyltransferase